MESIQFQGFDENDNFTVGDTRLSTENKEYCMYDFQKKDLDYNWIPVYYSFVEPWDCEPQLKATDLKFVSIDTKSVNTDDDESGSKDGVLRKYKKTRRGHAAGKKKRTHMLRRRGEKRLNVYAEVTDQPNAKRARAEEDRNISEIQEHGNIAVILDTLNASRQIEEPEAEGSDFFKWNRRGRGF